jgi:peptidoglycan hydrolase CwlO-like protein
VLALGKEGGGVSELEVVQAANQFLDGRLPPEAVVEAALETDREKLPGVVSNTILDLRYESPASPRFNWLIQELLRLEKEEIDEANKDRADELIQEAKDIENQIDDLEEEIWDLRREREDKIDEWQELTGKQWQG